VTGEVRTHIVAAGEAELRLDRWFKRHFPALSHGRLEKLLRTGQVRVNGRRAKAGLRLAEGQTVRVPPLFEGNQPGEVARPRATSARALSDKDARFAQGLVIYRDEDVIAVNKPPGLAVQGGSRTERHLDGLLDALRFGASERPRLVHRLDKDTSGVLLLGRSTYAAARLAEAFREKTTRKIYWAITVGVPRPLRGKIDWPLSKRPGRPGPPSRASRKEAVQRAAAEHVVLDAEEGKRAITYYSVVEHMGRKAAWVALWPVTGRTHQLRVHLAALGTPILGDGKYGGSGGFLAGEAHAKKLHLHARAIAVPHPRTGRPITVAAPLPEHMRTTWRFFGFDPETVEDPFAALEP